MTPALSRPNMLDVAHEPWRPPLFVDCHSRRQRLLASVRRLLDLQGASIWIDLKMLLPACRGTVLDVGCGAQPYRQLLPSGACYLGIDTINAQAHFGYDMPDTLYFDGPRWPVADASVDTVIATETLEHVPDPEVFLSEARRALRPGGTLILTVPFSARWHYVPHDYWRFTPSGLKQLLVGQRFNDLRVYARGNEVTVACYKAMAIALALVLGKYKNSFQSLLGRSVGLLLSPCLVPLALLAHCSLCCAGGNDCLGYTVTATA